MHEALRAADRLADDGIKARVVDLYSLKPVDTATLRAAASLTGRFVTVEDPRPEGGLGDAVQEAFADGTQAPRIVRLAVRGKLASATPTEQLHAAGIDADAITAAALSLLDGQPGGHAV